MGHTKDPSLNAADIKTLKARAHALKSRLERLEWKVACLQAPGAGRGRMAAVDSNLCAGCGRCTEVCPTRAIEVKEKIARVDAARCRGCGLCADACPQGAVSLQARRTHSTRPGRSTGRTLEATRPGSFRARGPSGPRGAEQKPFV